MKSNVELDPQVVDFVRALAPEPRKLVRRALRGLEQGRGNLKQLEGDLAGYCRLRVGGYRVIVRLYMRRGQQLARCVYAAPRSVVYEVFADLLTQT